MINRRDAAQALELIAWNAVQALRSSLTVSEGLDDIGRLRLVELAVDQARRALVADLREAGATWEDIGDALGVTRQAAQQRFGG